MDSESKHVKQSGDGARMVANLIGGPLDGERVTCDADVAELAIRSAVIYEHTFVYNGGRDGKHPNDRTIRTTAVTLNETPRYLRREDSCKFYYAGMKVLPL